ncbi:MAG: alpha/beta hydrolase [Kiritimatiellia bacterium]|jgi:acetyl esterase/lipase
MNTLPLWNTPVDGELQPYLTPFLLPGETVRPCIIVCPGGGYCHRARHEADPIAQKFNELGFHAFVLEYRVHPQAHYPEPQRDALRAIKIVRSRADEFHVRPDAIAILGFSAGGHLAGSASFLYDKVEANAGDAADAVSARPDASILCYAVLSGVEGSHGGSFKNLLGTETPAEADLLALSAERNVDADTPPAFLWHTAEDGAVPVENSLNYAAALRKGGIPFALHVFPFGPHGVGLAPDRPDVSRWPDLCADFLHRLGW